MDAQKQEKILSLRAHFAAAAGSGVLSEAALHFMAQTALVVERPQADQNASTGKCIIFYSGPARSFRSQLPGGLRRNWERSKALARATGARHIEDASNSFDRLFGKDSWFRLKNLIFPPLEKSKYLSPVIDVVCRAVGAYCSRKYAGRASRHVETLVCGSDHQRMFYEVELPALLQNPAVETINHIDAALVRDMAREVCFDQAFNLVCLSELRSVYARAAQGIDGIGKNDYYEGLASYTLERQEAAAITGPFTLAQNQRRRQILEAAHLA